MQLDQAQSEDGRSRLLALDTKSGEVAWDVARPLGSGWSTPIAIRVAGKDQLVTVGSPWVIAYDPAGGEEIWRADCMKGGFWPVPSATFAAGLVFAGMDSALLAAIRPDGRGDVSRSHVAWTAEADLPNVCSPVSDGRLVFTLTSGGWLTCYEARTGRKCWVKDFVAMNRIFESSPVIAGGCLYILDNNGVMFMVRVAEKFESVGQCSLGEECTSSTPAISRGRIYIRAIRNLYCIGR